MLKIPATLRYANFMRATLRVRTHQQKHRFSNYDLYPGPM